MPKCQLRLSSVLLAALGISFGARLVYIGIVGDAATGAQLAVLPAVGTDLRGVALPLHSVESNGDSAIGLYAIDKEGVKGKCVLLVHFEQDCPWSAQLANQWRELETRLTGIEALWVAHSSSVVLARRFVERFDLGDSWLQYGQGNAASSPLAVGAVPAFTLVRDSRIIFSGQSSSGLLNSEEVRQCQAIDPVPPLPRTP